MCYHAPNFLSQGKKLIYITKRPYPHPFPSMEMVTNAILFATFTRNWGAPQAPVRKQKNFACVLTECVLAVRRAQT